MILILFHQFTTTTTTTGKGEEDSKASQKILEAIKKEFDEFLDCVKDLKDEIKQKK